jgi:hypothetical protein
MVNTGYANTIYRDVTVYCVYINHVVNDICTRITHDMMEEWRLVALSRGSDKNTAIDNMNLEGFEPSTSSVRWIKIWGEIGKYRLLRLLSPKITILF